MLSVSYMVKLSGVGLGLIFLTIGALVSYSSIVNLMRMSAESGKHTYAALFSHCAGPRASPFLDSLLIIYGNGSCIGYLVFLSDFMPSVLRFLFPGAPGFLLRRETTIWISIILVSPLAVLPDTSSLRFIAPVSICALIYMAVIVAVRAPAAYNKHHGVEGYGDVEYFRFGSHLPEAFAVCVFAYNCVLNVMPVVTMMIMPTRPRIRSVAGKVNALQFVFYCLIGVTGYLSFLSSTQQDLLNNYEDNDVFIVVGRVLLSATMLVAIPLNLNPTVRSGLQLAGYFGGVDLADRSARGGWAARVTMTAVFLVCAAAIAIVCPGVADVIALLGATVATMLVMVIPAYCMSALRIRTLKVRLQQYVLIGFAVVAFSSVPIKILRMCGTLPS